MVKILEINVCYDAEFPNAEIFPIRFGSGLSAYRVQTIHLLGIAENQEVFTTDTSLTRVRAVPRY
jgi:hypothetical protein